MSKVAAPVWGETLKSSIVGAAIALAAYVLLQLLTATLMYRELLSEESLYGAVCVTAGIAAFLGCGYSVLRRKSGAMLSSAAVAVVFLALTVAVAMLTEETVGEGQAGVGLSMALGGLAAALVGSRRKKSGKGRKKHSKRHS